MPGAAAVNSAGRRHVGMSCISISDMATPPRRTEPDTVLCASHCFRGSTDRNGFQEAELRVTEIAFTCYPVTDLRRRFELIQCVLSHPLLLPPALPETEDSSKRECGIGGGDGHKDPARAKARRNGQ